MDECLFSSDSYKGRHWAPSGQPFQAVKRFLNQPKIVVVGGVSNGNIHYKFGEFSFSSSDIIDFLRQLRARYNQGAKLAVFWDNCGIHKSHLVRSWLAEHDPELVLIFNIPYRPDLNGIELVWKDCK